MIEIKKFICFQVIQKGGWINWISMILVNDRITQIKRSRDTSPIAWNIICTLYDQILPFSKTSPSKIRMFYDLSNTELSACKPRKKKLMDVVHKNENHSSRTRQHTIKSLVDFSDEAVVWRLFKGMQSITSNSIWFLKSQIKELRALVELLFFWVR